MTTRLDDVPGIHAPPDCVPAPPSAPVIRANDERWSVWIDPNTTLLETVALMSGLRLIGISVEAHNIGDGVFALTPINPHREPPSAYELLQCMRLGARVPQAAPRLRFVTP